jgi:hypothetical protein
MTHTQHPLWRKWTYIQYTLNNPNHKQYAQAKKYGWTCDWDNFRSFASDIEQHLGLPLPGEMLIRKDQTQGWTLKNLDYGTEKVRGNRQRTCLILKYRNKKMTASQWAEYRGIPVGTLYSRLYHYHWPVAEALEYKKRT